MTTFMFSLGPLNPDELHLGPVFFLLFLSVFSPSAHSLTDLLVLISGRFPLPGSPVNGKTFRLSESLCQNPLVHCFFSRDPLWRGHILPPFFFSLLRAFWASLFRYLSLRDFSSQFPPCEICPKPWKSKHLPISLLMRLPSLITLCSTPRNTTNFGHPNFCPLLYPQFELLFFGQQDAWLELPVLSGPHRPPKSYPCKHLLFTSSSVPLESFSFRHSPWTGTQGIAGSTKKDSPSPRFFFRFIFPLTLQFPSSCRLCCDSCLSFRSRVLTFHSRTIFESCGVTSSDRNPFSLFCETHGLLGPNSPFFDHRYSMSPAGYRVDL